MHRVIKIFVGGKNGCTKEELEVTTYEIEIKLSKWLKQFRSKRIRLRSVQDIPLVKKDKV